MDMMDRRKILQGILSGVVAAGLGAGIVSTAAEAAPIPPTKDLANEVEPVAEKTQMTVGRPPRRGPHRHYRHHRRGWHRPRRVCWWRRGRRVCAWR